MTLVSGNLDSYDISAAHSTRDHVCILYCCGTDLLYRRSWDWRLAMASQSQSPGLNGPAGPPRRSLIILDSAHLAESPYLVPTAELLNEVFQQAHLHGCPGKELLSASVRRFQSGPQQLVDEIGPDGFCIIMFDEADTGADKEKVIIASGSAKPYKAPAEGKTHGSSTNMLFKRKPVASNPPSLDAAGTSLDGSSSNEARWELLAFGTDLRLKGQGIAGQINDLAVAEIRRRVEANWRTTKAAKADEGALGQDIEGKASTMPKVVLMLSTLQELNETYYLRRGWKTTSVRRFEPGTNDSKDGFGVVEMIKPLD